ncbi:MAG: S24/S26 family peptidase [Bacteroidaceae bacterium]|nr:S24/S26 family peptidase [Bacteroidaceae bacterium]
MKDEKKENVVELPNDLFLKGIGELLQEGHTATLRVRGNSMRPFLEDRRDSIVLTSVTHIEVGDAVLAEIAPGKYVFHRIIAIDGDIVTLMGDGNVRGTEHCTKADVKANALAVVRKGKEYRTDGRRWIRYSKAWMRLTPVRRWLLAIHRRLPKNWR